MSDTHLWRSPPPHQTPLIEPGSLPNLMSPELTNSKELLHPSFLPPCQHGKDEGDMHAHAFDLLSLSQHSPAPKPSPLPTVVPSSVPVQSVLSATRPPAAASASGSAPKVRRMSSSTTGVLGRGKLAATGDSLGLGGVTKDVRPTLISSATSYSATSPIPNRKPVLSTTGTSPTPQLFDFAKTDRVKMTSRSVSSSMPSRSLPAHAEKDDMELEMAFDDEDDSASVDMDGEEGEEWKKLALGTGSGGVKGRRAGMVFKCENCGKEYRHPSCLIKHRWEHSPHWKEPTAISMSKHQQVQMLEAAAILAHLGPQQRKVLPTDRSLWPAILSPSDGRRPSMSSRDPSSVRSPPSSTAPLTPSSLRETSTLGELGRGGPQQRKSSPDSDSTTSSMGEGYVPTQTGVSPARPLGISRQISSQSSAPGPGTPQSFGSLPREMASFHINNSYKDARLLNGGPGLSPSGVSPIPHRSMGMSPSLKSRTGLVGGGMFGAIHTVRPSSSVRSGAMGDDEDEGISEREARGKSSSEEAEDRRKAGDGEDWGMAMEMEL